MISQLFFKVIYDQQEIEIKSEELIEFNFNEISNLKKIKGILNITQIN